MISWMQIIDIGHTAVMIPVAGAIAACLASAKAYKLAFWWCAIFTSGLGLVAMSKMAFLGWGVELPLIGFKALSGHAWRATAVLPVLFFVLLRTAPGVWRTRGVLLGVALSLGLGALLVALEFHTASEVIASTVLGIGASGGFIRVARHSVAQRASPWTVPVGLLTFAIIWGLKPSVVTPRLVDVALYLSGRDSPYRWSHDPEQLAPPAYEPEDARKRCRARFRY